MEMHKIIVQHDSKTTTEEKLLQMKEQMEKAFNTGPIIGEGAELIMHLLNNLYSRDLFLDAMDIPVEQREEIFRDIQKMMEERDQEILNERK